MASREEMNLSAGAFESFNARTMSPREVATKFVPPAKFWSLLRSNHALLVGPRGSGKTTLLKMLDDSALAEWKHPRAQALRADLGFVGVFVPSDRLWREDFLAVTRGIPEETATRFGYATFVAQTLRALTIAVQQRLELHNRGRLTENSRRNEVTAVREIASQLGVEVEVPSLSGLQSAISLLLFEIAKSSRRAGRTGIPDERVMQFSDIPLFESVSFCLDAVESLSPRLPGRWAFLFDELELAPDRVIDELMLGLRSVDGRILLKLGLSPNAPALDRLIGAADAQPNQDFEIVDILMGGSDKDDIVPFSEELVRGILKRRQWPSSDLESVFGRSSMARSSEKLKGNYAPDSENAARMRDLARVDSSYANYLRERDVDPDRLEQLGERVRAQAVRKTIEVVAVRLEYMIDQRQFSPDQRVQRLKSRRSPRIYSGMPALLQLCEGNPRWIIGMVNRMLDAEGELPGGGQSVSVSESVQSVEITRVVGIFRAFLRSLPLPASGGDHSRRSLIALVDGVGDEFRKSTHGADFNPDPVLSFTVDGLADEVLVRLVRVGIAAGAFVPVGASSGAAAQGKIAGGKFRLARILDPYFLLPPVAGRAKNLTSLLSATRGRPAANPLPMGDADHV